MPTDPAIVLCAEDIFTKYGFEDGDLLSNHLSVIDIWIENDHETLCWIVRHTLLPAIPFRLEVEEIDTHHNPIRATKEYMHLAEQVEAMNIKATVSLDDVMLISDALSRGQDPEQHLRDKSSSPQTHLIGTEPTLGSVSHEGQNRSSTDSS